MDDQELYYDFSKTESELIANRASFMLVFQSILFAVGDLEKLCFQCADRALTAMNTLRPQLIRIIGTECAIGVEIGAMGRLAG